MNLTQILHKHLLELGYPSDLLEFHCYRGGPDMKYITNEIVLRYYSASDKLPVQIKELNEQYFISIYLEGTECNINSLSTPETLDLNDPNFLTQLPKIIQKFRDQQLKDFNQSPAPNPNTAHTPPK